MSFLSRLFTGGAPQRVTARHPLVIPSPRIAFLNLIGVQAESLVAADRDAFGGLFAFIETSSDDAPNCDVLVIYCELGLDGATVGQSRNLRDVIDSASAKIAIVASNNSADGYIVAGKSVGHAPVNLAMVLDRKGDAFAQFFAQIFSRMYDGESMLSAWKELAPQHTGIDHDGCPESIFAAEIGHLVFERE